MILVVLMARVVSFGAVRQDSWGEGRAKGRGEEKERYPLFPDRHFLPAFAVRAEAAGSVDPPVWRTDARTNGLGGLIFLSFP